jgi:prepilin-type N-terminal cleavage/methylation domain-containing protein
MLPPSRRFKASVGPQGRRLRVAAAFTLLEIVIALAVLGVMSGACYIGFNSISAYGVSTRLFSEAQTAAQNQTDLVLSKEPFDPSTSGAYISGTFNPCLNKIPVELMTTAELDILASTNCPGTSGAVVFPTTAPTATPATTDPYYPYYPYYRDGSSPNVLKKQAFIYNDPVTGIDIVKGVLASTVTDTGMTMSFVNATATKLNTRRANIAVTYTFRGRNYTVSLDTLRAGNQ